MRRVATGALMLLLAACGSDTHDGPPGELGDALAGVEPAAEPFDGLTALEVSVGGEHLDVVVADSATERSDGLRDRTDRAPYDGMLFVNSADSRAAFTMSGVSEPLDLAFYAADGTRTGGHAMTPCPDGRGCPTYESDQPWRYAIETSRGELPDGPLEAVAPPR